MPRDNITTLSMYLRSSCICVTKHANHGMDMESAASASSTSDNYAKDEAKADMPFLDLPAEIQNHIYRDTLISDATLTILEH